VFRRFRSSQKLPDVPSALNEVTNQSLDGQLEKKEVEIPLPLKDDTSIEAILARSRHKDLIERVGPQALRYLPSEDPNALLLPDSRLEPPERRWQKIFVALPWLTFALMLGTPLLLVYGNLPFLQQRAEHQRQAGPASRPEAKVASFQVVNFGQMPDVLERPFPTMLMLFHPATYASKVFLPALQELEGLLRLAQLPVSVAALDLTASPSPPASFLWQYPAAGSPHLQLILPRSLDGEAGIVDYDGPWSSRALSAAACRLAGPAAELPVEEVERLEGQIQRLRDLLFDLLFLEEPRITEASRWQRWFGSRQDGESEREHQRQQMVHELVERIELHSGLEAAIASCEKALAKLREAGS